MSRLASYPSQAALFIALCVSFVTKTGLEPKDAPNLQPHTHARTSAQNAPFCIVTGVSGGSPVIRRDIRVQWIVVRLRKPCRKRRPITVTREAHLAGSSSERGASGRSRRGCGGILRWERHLPVYSSFTWSAQLRSEISLLAYLPRRDVLRHRSTENDITKPTCSCVGGAPVPFSGSLGGSVGDYSGFLSVLQWSGEKPRGLAALPSALAS